MSRRYGDRIEVWSAGAGPAGSAGAGAPVAFRWRGHRYAVRSVLGHWCERRAWWTGAAAAAVHGARPIDGAPPAEVTAAALGAEREVWRVEATRGAVQGIGIYDLARDPAPPGDPAPGREPPPARSLPGSRPAGAPQPRWRLLRVVD